MANVVYGQMGGTRDPLFGKFEHKIKAFIENESNICEQEKTILDTLFNVETSNSYSEAYTGETGFDTFMSMDEGQSVENDSVVKTFDKVFTHHQFGKSFHITRQMADDAKIGMGAAMTSKPKAFARAFYRTRVKAAEMALANATSRSMIFNRAEFDLTAADGKPLFSIDHPYADAKYKSRKQSNAFDWRKLHDDAYSYKPDIFAEGLELLSGKFRNFRDENGDAMGYVPDTIILPCNRAGLENVVKKTCGSERVVGSGNNDINTQYGNWNVVVLNNWETSDDRFMIMSKAANEQLNGNMFFNRVNLEVRSWVDNNTFNYMWSGYARFGLGFNAWKHMALCVCDDGDTYSALS